MRISAPNSKYQPITCGILALLTYLAIPSRAGTPQNLSARVASGQVFLVWDEDPAATAYNVYRFSSTAPTEAQLVPANQAITVPKGFADNPILADLSQGQGSFSNSGWTNLDPPCVITRNVLDPLDASGSGLAEPLPTGKNMVVLTTHHPGTYYYVVTSVAGGQESKAISAAAGGNQAGPLTEVLANPEPLLIWKSGFNSARIYLQYVDIENLNSRAYAWPYWVGTSGQPKQARNGHLQLRLDGGDQHMRDVDDSVSEYERLTRGIDIKVQPTENWEMWYGHSSGFDFLANPSGPTTAGPIVNYTQARIMDFLQWMIERSPYYSAQIDTNQITVRGTSNGGCGCLQFSFNYPDFFASSQCVVPPTNIVEIGYGGTALTRFFGDGTGNLPVEFRGWRSGPLQTLFGGMRVDKWLNLETIVLEKPGRDLPFIQVGHGGLDNDVPWPKQGRGLYTNLNAGHHGFSGQLTGGGDHNNSFAPAVTQLVSIRKNHSYPAISNSKLNAALPLPEAPETRNYLINTHILWSSPTYKVGGFQNTIDETNRYEIVLASTDGDDVADVTPRRLQHFRIIPGAVYAIQNVGTLNPGQVYQADTAVADSNGLLIIRKFQIKSGDQASGGSRLIVVPRSPISIGREEPSLRGNRRPGKPRPATRLFRRASVPAEYDSNGRNLPPR